MNLERAGDAGFINYVANHPNVRDGLLAPRGGLDYSPVVADQRNVVLVGEFGGMVFHFLLPGLYEVHTQTLPDGRGEWTLQMGQAALEWMFTRTSATEILTRVPDGNKGALNLTLNLGGVREHQMALPIEGQNVTMTIYRLTIQDWIKTAPGLEEVGEKFHADLHRQYDRAGVQVARHAHDPWHDRHVGAAYLMFMNGQPAKGVGYYNRWAAMAAAPLARILSFTPDLVVDIRDARLLVRDGGFKLLRGH